MTDIATYALTTLADVKETLGIDAGNTSKDNLIIRNINRATDTIEGYCGLDNDHHFKSGTYTNELYDATDTDQLVLKAWPVTTLTTLASRDTLENGGSFTTIDTTDYYLEANTAIITGLSSFYGFVAGWRVTYTAGFSTIPSDLAEACASLAAALTESSTSGAAVKKKEEGQRSIEYFQSGQASSLIDELGLDDILQRYVRYAI